MKKENFKSPKKGIQHEKDRWIDVRNDEVMIGMGLLRCPTRTPRDPSVWTKTPKEKRLLKSLRHSNKEDMHFEVSSKIHYIPVRAKLVIQLLPNKKYPKTTYSTECWQYEIPDILSRYRMVSRGLEHSAVAKYSFNSRTYLPDEFPF